MYADDDYTEQDSWVCSRCSVINYRNEKKCRLCELPRYNECTGCKREADKAHHFCKYCGAPTVFFLRAVFDEGERELARKSSRKLISEWKKHGVKYLNIEDEYDYVQQLEEYGEIVVPHWK